MKILTLLYRISICNKLRCFFARKKIAEGYKLRSNDEILKKKDELHDKMLANGRVKNLEQMNRYQAMIDTLDYIVGVKSDIS